MWQINALGAFFFLLGFRGQNTARGARFSLGFSMYLILAQKDQVYLILSFALNKTTDAFVGFGQRQPRQL